MQAIDLSLLIWRDATICMVFSSTLFAMNILFHSLVVKGLCVLLSFVDQNDSSQKANNNEMNKIFSNPESKSESDTEIESGSENKEYSDSVTECTMKISDNENASSNHKSSL